MNARIEFPRSLLAGGHAARPGKVHLVGAGPGDPDLLTVKAARLLREADVVVIDHLVSPQVLALIGAQAERIHAGKQRNHHTLKQHEINALLVSLARQGRQVVRLKEILGSPAALKRTVVREIEADARQFGDARRSQIVPDSGDLRYEDLTRVLRDLADVRRRRTELHHDEKRPQADPRTRRAPPDGPALSKERQLAAARRWPSAPPSSR